MKQPVFRPTSGQFLFWANRSSEASISSNENKTEVIRSSRRAGHEDKVVRKTCRAVGAILANKDKRSAASRGARLSLRSDRKVVVTLQIIYSYLFLNNLHEF
ncbi:hypothetical protein EVAR_14819_1 [Eumeta japonica]|uniref:Uncharacterized protein n=1 Tax=Eumeta variegata TaxID=151549 RepID=A0A4C1V3K6_EUMVA|nr:hypothetical protein EVAR_14819_1 [Eumeta japonica]